MVALLFLLVLGLEKAQQLPASAYGVCRAFRLCGPAPLKPIPNLSTGWLPSGSTWDSASRSALEKARQDNPDYDITFIPGQEHGSCDGRAIKIDCQYRYEGRFAGTPKWRGLIDRLGLGGGVRGQIGSASYQASGR